MQILIIKIIIFNGAVLNQQIHIRLDQTKGVFHKTRVKTFKLSDENGLDSALTMSTSSIHIMNVKQGWFELTSSSWVYSHKLVHIKQHVITDPRKWSEGSETIRLRDKKRNEFCKTVSVGVAGSWMDKYECWMQTYYCVLILQPWSCLFLPPQLSSDDMNIKNKQAMTNMMINS